MSRRSVAGSTASGSAKSGGRCAVRVGSRSVRAVPACGLPHDPRVPFAAAALSRCRAGGRTRRAGRCAAGADRARSDSRPGVIGLQRFGGRTVIARHGYALTGGHASVSRAVVRKSSAGVLIRADETRSRWECRGGWVPRRAADESEGEAAA